MPIIGGMIDKMDLPDPIKQALGAVAASTIGAMAGGLAGASTAFNVDLNNRQLHKATIKKGGKRQRNTAPKEVHGFRLFDCVRYQGTTCFVFGRRSSGYFDLRALDGTKMSPSARYTTLKVIQRASARLVERRAAFLPTA